MDKARNWLLMTLSLLLVMWVSLIVAAASAAPPEPVTRIDLATLTEVEIALAEQVVFDIDKDRIKPKSFAVLDAARAILVQHPEVKIEVQVHAADGEERGSAKPLQSLSKRRAAAVARYLTSTAVDGARVHHCGYGMERPLVPNDSDSNRARNRRVQLVRITTEAPCAAPTPGWRPH